MTRAANESEYWKEFSELAKGAIPELHEQTDRAAAILATAFLDELLRRLLVDFMVDDHKEVGRLLDVERPLGAFGARIGAAYCLGLLTKEEYADLRTIQKVRNRFAHELGAHSFQEESIRDRCHQIKTAPPETRTESEIEEVFGSWARYKFIAAFSVLAGRFTARAWIDLKRNGVRRTVRPSP